MRATHPAWPVTRLVQMLTGEQDRLARLGAGDLQVRAAFEVSYAQLAEEDARLFRLLGLHPARTSLPIRRRPWPGPGPRRRGRCWTGWPGRT